MTDLLLSTGIAGRLTQHQRGHGPALLIDTPILVLRDALRSDIASLRRLAPGSDTLTSLADVEARLTVAIAEGRDADAWVDTEEAALHLGVKVSAITKRCRKRQIASRKSGGIWQIHKSALSEAA